MVNTVALKDASVMHQPNEQEPEGQQGQQQGDSRPDVIICPVRMTSVVRVSKLPVIEGTLKIATDMYKKAKNANRVFNWSLKKAEFTVSKAAKSTAPVVLKLQTPILKVDSLLCAGLDFVEAKVPAVKLPPHQMYANTKQFVKDCAQPCMNCADALKCFGTRNLLQLGSHGYEKVELEVAADTKSHVPEGQGNGGATQLPPSDATRDKDSGASASRSAP